MEEREEGFLLPILKVLVVELIENLIKLMTANVMHMIPSKLNLVKMKTHDMLKLLASSIPKNGNQDLTMRLPQAWMLMSW